MGMYDVVRLPEPRTCSHCGGRIETVQTQAFEASLTEYAVGDCPAHAEETRIVREELFCTPCHEGTGEHAYLVVNRGILVGVAASFGAAETLIGTLSKETLVLWHHDVCRRLSAERRGREHLLQSVQDALAWFRATPEERDSSFRWLLSRPLLEGAADPLEALERILKTSREGLGRPSTEEQEARDLVGEGTPASSWPEWARDLMEQATEALGSEEKASRWVRKPNMALGGVRPIDAFGAESGRRQVLELLDRIVCGIFS